MPLIRPGFILVLNEVDVSASLNIRKHEQPNRQLRGLASNKLLPRPHHLTETGGQSSTNEFYFDTFSETTHNIAKLVEWKTTTTPTVNFQNDPPRQCGWFDESN